MYKTGDRVKVQRVMDFEPCCAAIALIGETGTVVDLVVDDEDPDDGYSLVRVEVVLDNPVDCGGHPAHLSSTFVLYAEELEAEQE